MENKSQPLSQKEKLLIEKFLKRKIKNEKKISFFSPSDYLPINFPKTTFNSIEEIIEATKDSHSEVFFNSKKNKVYIREKLTMELDEVNCRCTESIVEQMRQYPHVVIERVDSFDMFMKTVMNDNESDENEVGTPKAIKKKIKTSDIAKLCQSGGLQKMIKSGVLIKGVHYERHNVGYTWNESAIEVIKKIHHVTEEEKENYIALYNKCIGLKGMNDNKLATQLAKILNRKTKAIYSYIYTFNTKRITKNYINLYTGPLMQVLENHKKENEC